ncbi:HK97 gp10 family phage protein [Sphingobium sp. H39-3-25]|uniref:HK97 gp10 family phage protein n=1 Tax=Sphingobium arseniciresistens TaxID=3030834 RepID=UPI0023BA28A9|nr:HK97 gp10 family phage protein [Sphingobium arseniciresistens]
MPRVSGRDSVRDFIARIPADVEKRLLRGAARAGANVIADEARDRSISDEVTAAIKVSTSIKDGQVVGRVQVKGKGAYIAPWLEYGTAPHFISVDDSQRGGMSVRKVNSSIDPGSLMIGGKFVGKTVHHPGARPNPFLRVSLDMKEQEAFAAAGRYIAARVTRAGIIGSDEGDET